MAETISEFDEQTLEDFTSVDTTNVGFNIPQAFVKVSDNAILPSRKTKQSAGFDLCVDGYKYINGDCVHRLGEEEVVTLAPGADCYLGTGVRLGGGLSTYLPGTFFLMALRPSLRTKGLTMNGIGIIDVDYLDEILVYAKNTGQKSITLTKGVRIAQLIPVTWSASSAVFEKYTEQNTRAGGFGSTGE